MTDPECVLSKSVSLECWDGSQEVCSSCHASLISPHESCQGWSHFPSKGARGPMDLYFENLCPLPGLGRVFLLSPERSSLPCFPHPSWLLGVSGRMRLPGETKAQGGPPWQIVLSFSIPVRFAIWVLSCTSCFLVSILPLPSIFSSSWLTFLFFVFSFPAACHRNDTYSAKSALDSFLQTRTTNSPVREQSERKMKNNIRKEPFGKLHKKCYIKIDTRAWPFVVLYILKPSIDSLLITCLF